MNILREKLNEKMYGYPFMEIEVLKNNNREYLLYDPDESRFVKDTMLVFLMRLVGHTEF